MPNNTTNQETFKTLDAVKQYQIKSMTTMPNELTDFQEVQTQSLILSDLMGKLVDLYTDIIYNEDYTNIDIDMIKKIHKEFSRKSKSIMNLRFGELNEEAILEMADSNLNLGPVIKIMVGSTRKMSRLLEWVEFMNMASIAYSIFISHFVNINKNRILYRPTKILTQLEYLLYSLFITNIICNNKIMHNYLALNGFQLFNSPSKYRPNNLTSISSILL